MKIRRQSGLVHPMNRRAKGRAPRELAPASRFLRQVRLHTDHPHSLSAFVSIDDRMDSTDAIQDFTGRAAAQLHRISQVMGRLPWRADIAGFASPLNVHVAHEWPSYHFLRAARPPLAPLPTIVLHPGWRRSDFAHTVAHELGHHFHRERYVVGQGGRVAVLPWRVAALQKLWWAEARSPMAHRVAPYFSTISQGPGRVLGCAAPWSRCGYPSKTTRGGWGEFLAEAFALTVTQRQRVGVRQARAIDKFKTAFPKALRAYWKVFHGSPYPTSLRRISKAR